MYVLVRSSLREDVISVKPNSADGCSDSAVVTVLTRQASTHKVIVLAEDKGTTTHGQCAHGLAQF